MRRKPEDFDTLCVNQISFSIVIVPLEALQNTVPYEYIHTS